jgi:hypothetical protein
MTDALPDPDGDRDASVHVGSDLARAPSMPRWVKVFGIAFLVLVVLFIAMVASGHGPGRHMPGMAAPGGLASPVGALDDGARQS